MDELLQGLKQATNYTRTENGDLTHKSTLSKVLDLFAFGGAYRGRNEQDIIQLFSDAYNENPELALKCLFYIRDIRGGAGEREFFRVCLKWLADNHPDTVRRNLEFVPFVGRWDDLLCLIETPLCIDALALFDRQLRLDLQSITPSLAAKWAPSANASSAQSKKYAQILTSYMRLTAREYRKMLAALRAKIRIVETLMSQNRWDEIEFDKLPSKAGFKYRNAFARNDFTRERYEAFMKSNSTKVNGKTLFPYEVVKAAKEYQLNDYGQALTANRAAINKYWDNLKDHFDGAAFNGIAVVDTSASMRYGVASVEPIDVAISLGMYCAMKSESPFKNHYISFSREAKLVEINGKDFVEKVGRIYKANLCQNTNIESVFDLLYKVIKFHNIPNDKIPEYLIIISDQQYDKATATIDSWENNTPPQTTLEHIHTVWETEGIKCPKMIFWNVNAKNLAIPALGDNVYSYVSGFSPAIFKQIMSNKTGEELMLETICADRYKDIK